MSALTQTSEPAGTARAKEPSVSPQAGPAATLHDPLQHELVDPLQMAAWVQLHGSSVSPGNPDDAEGPVQLSGAAKATSAVKSSAAQGVSGSGGALPHLDKIQASFGKHDVSAIKAHTGAAAQQANANIGAKAFATGDQVAFGGSPDLHTTAHEAAHTVQQKSGVSLSGGVGKVGDRYESHADSVADLVVQGKSAESELDKMSGGDDSDQAVQGSEMDGDVQMKDDETKGAGSVVATTAKSVGKGLTNAVLPVFAVVDMVKNIQGNHAARKDGTAPWGDSAFWTYFSDLKEVTQIVATVATAVNVVSSIVALFPAATPVAGPIAAVFGIIALIAHSVTALLRGITMIKLATIKRSDSSDQQWAARTKMLWSEGASLVGNLIGVVAGGVSVGGGGGVGKVIAESAKKGSTTVGSVVAGQAINTSQDLVGGLGGGIGKVSESKMLNKDNDTKQLSKLPSLSEVKKLSGDESNFKKGIEIEEKSLKEAKAKLTKLDTKVTDSKSQNTKLESQPTDFTENKNASQSEVKKGEKAAEKAEQQGAKIGLQPAKTTTEADTKAQEVQKKNDTSAPVQAKADGAPVQMGLWSWAKKGASAVASGAKAVGGAVASGAQAVGGAVASGAKAVGGAVSSGAKWLVGAIFNVAKRLKKMLAGAKAKLQSKFLRMLGIEQPMADAQAQMTEQEQFLPQASKDQDQAGAAAADFAKKYEEVEKSKGAAK